MSTLPDVDAGQHERTGWRAVSGTVGERAT
jgi:hypothetical protein